MTIYGQNKGYFKRENNECIGTGARTTLPETPVASGLEKPLLAR